MNKLFKLILLFIVFNSCNAQKANQGNSCINISDIENFIKDEIIKLDNNNQILDSKVLEKPNLGNSLADFLIPGAFHLMSKINIKSKKDIIDFTKKFNQEDFDYMKCQLKHNKIKDWKQILKNRNFKKNDSIKSLISKYKTWNDIYKDENYQEILRLKSKYLYHSIPLFSKDKKYALIYREFHDSGSLFVLKKLNNKWILYGRSFLWSSD